MARKVYPSSTTPLTHPLMRALAEHRRSVGHSQSSLAVRSGYSRQDIQRWESGDAFPKLPAFVDLAEAVGLEIRLVPKEEPRTA